MRYLLKRILSIIPVLFITSVIVFLIIHLIPGDPAEIVAGPGVPQEEVENIRRLMGLDKPLITQYFDWLFRALTGDFGISLTSPDPIFPLVMTRFGNTLILSLLGISFAVVIGIPMGVLSAVKQNSVIDIAVMIISIIGISMPIFWLGLILVKFFSIEWRLLPATGSGGLLNLVLPSVTVGLNSLAIIARMTRASMLEVLRQDYITTAEAKGLNEMTIIFRHALKNSLIPIVTTIGIQFGYLMGGAVLTETVFVYPGLGRLLVDSIRRMDYPVVQACILLIATMFILVTLLVDLLYAYLNPKIKYGN